MKLSKLIIIDISSFIFRSYYAIRPLSAPDGRPINAVYGVLSMLLKIFEEHNKGHLILARDSKEKTFRHEMYSLYKANRTDPPDDLKGQFQIIDDLIHHMKIPEKKLPGFEADDIIGSLVLQWKDKFKEIDIISGDKDLMQFVSDHVYMLDTKIDKKYGKDEVFEKMGVFPFQIVDYLSMVGDSSDNIPGMKGIGAKGASKLLAEYQTLKGCFENKDKITNKRVKEAFENYYENGLLSKKLVTIDTNLNLEMEPVDTKFEFQPDSEFLKFLDTLGFKKHIEKLKKDFSIQNSKKEAVFETIDISSQESLENFFSETKKRPIVSLYSEYNSEKDYSIAFAVNEKTVFSFLRQEEDQKQKIIEESLWKFLWESYEGTLIGNNLKKDMSYFFPQGLEVSPRLFDISQAFYNLDTQQRFKVDYELSKILKTSFYESDLDEENKIFYVGERAFALLQCYPTIQEKIKNLNVEKIYYEIDLPLILILSEMEHIGIKINLKHFKKLEENLDRERESITEEIKSLGEMEEINLNSPKQVSQLLFEKLNLPIIKKTKTGLSTDVEVLSELNLRNLHPIPGKILRLREVEKLLSTYVRVLPKLADDEQRVHTTFNQFSTGTGRLSSDNPNLQNIPVRTESGRLVRKGFISEEGHIFLAADYSQVELRLLAHFSKDPSMMEAFNRGEDIHAQTASEVTGIPLKEISKKERGIAKAVNFGLMYGQSSFGLAKSLRISRPEARDYIQRYFERFPKVKGYLDSLKELCEKKGYTETLLGRKRFLPEIHSENRTLKGHAERMAINGPIQGTAADMLKVAMIRIDKEIKALGLSSKMLLQVHDELIFEVPQFELKEMAKLVSREMGRAIQLDVPLKVDLSYGNNWAELKPYP